MRRVPRKHTGPITVVHTDGSCKDRKGGWAWAHGAAGPRGAGGAHNTTNQRMELQAAWEAVKANPGRLVIVSDSAYVVNCFKDKWYEKWFKKNFVGVANSDLWRPFLLDVLARGNVRFRWVKGHSGDPMNELVDRLALKARLSA